ncbi:MAG: RHS repeat-associated core domain-containing protein [Thermomicrobiales bacterium]
MGLYYMRGRWYDPELGRFIQEDPIGTDGGINVYAFAGNDPVNGSDPSGLWTDNEIQARLRVPAMVDGSSSNGGSSIGGRGVSTLGFAGERSAGWTPEANAIAEGNGPGRRLTDAEIKQLGNLCNAVDCSTITILPTPFPRSFTFDHTIFLSNNDKGDASILAHEMTHVARYDQFGALRYITDGVVAQTQYDLGTSDPYNYLGKLDGRTFYQYGIEQQGQMVQDCVRNPRRLTCFMVPYP